MNRESGEILEKARYAYRTGCWNLLLMLGLIAVLAWGVRWRWGSGECALYAVAVLGVSILALLLLVSLIQLKLLLRPEEWEGESGDS